MQAPLHYQVSEYDCVPTALINGISYLFHRKEIPPMVIRHIFLYCLDTVGKDSRFGVGGTSKYAVRLVGNWLNAYRIKDFSVQTKFIEKKAVGVHPGGKIETCLTKGGIVLCNMFITPREEHYIMLIAMDDQWVYCFDSYRRSFIRGIKDHVRVLETRCGRTPNLKIRRSWFEGLEKQRFCLGPVASRECLLMWRP